MSEQADLLEHTIAIYLHRYGRALILESDALMKRATAINNPDSLNLLAAAYVRNVTTHLHGAIQLHETLALEKLTLGLKS